MVFAEADLAPCSTQLLAEVDLTPCSTELLAEAAFIRAAQRLVWFPGMRGVPVLYAAKPKEVGQGLLFPAISLSSPPHLLIARPVAVRLVIPRAVTQSVQLDTKPDKNVLL